MRTLKLLIIILFLLCGNLYAQDSASLQFTVAAPDPVMAGDEVKFQTLVVNTGSSSWLKGTYYWVAEVYSIVDGERKFLAQTESVSPGETVPPSSAHGTQLSFRIPDNFIGKRLLYRVFLIKGGRRILESDYKGFQIIEKEFKPPVSEDFRVGGDISFTYKNSDSDGWNNHQGITSANMVGKIKNSSFLFNTYIIHTKSRPINPNIVLLNLYAPWGNLSIGDISPVLTPLSLDGQGMRGVSLEKREDRSSSIMLIGRIVSPEEPSSISAGRFARYAVAGKYSYYLSSTLKISGDAVYSKDDEFSINIDTDTSTMLPQKNIVYGTSLEWKPSSKLTFLSDYQISSFKADLNSAVAPRQGSAWKEEMRYRGKLFTARAAVSNIDTKYISFASPSVIPDRFVYDGEINIYPCAWTSFALSYNSYTDNLQDDPAKTTTTQTQMTLGNSLKLFGRTLLNTSILTNASVGEPKIIQDNETTTLNVSVLQPVKDHTLNVSVQNTSFKDNTGLSHDLDTGLFSFSGAFKISKKISLSAGFVGSTTKDKVDSTQSENTSITGNLTYSMPQRRMAFQIWTTMNSNMNDSLTYPSDTGRMSINAELLWIKAENLKLTFGVGSAQNTDNLNPQNDISEISVLTRFNYSF
ncbi:MAG: hypothetical protein KAQ76_04585 [Elusimicrobiales bacterium]|nr:hypothetical protein [Elusimicrobiales bacterium]